MIVSPLKSYPRTLPKTLPARSGSLAVAQAPSWNISDSFATSIQVGQESRPSGESSIPDVRGMLARHPRYSELNLEINKVYVVMAEMFQDIFDPEHQMSPSWYGFAPFASRQAGGSIRMAESLIKTLELGHDSPSHSIEWEQELQREFPDEGEREAASQTLSLLGPTPEEGPHAQGIGDVVHLGIAANRLRKILAKTSGTARERLLTVARTTRNMLEDGNRRIVSEIGVAGQDYLTFRQARQPSPQEVLEQFTVASTEKNPEQARRVYDLMETVVKGDGPLKTDWDKEFPADSFDRTNFLVAGFAAYEAARLETDPRLKSRWIDQAGALIAFREQFDIVQGAFQGDVREGEVDRKELMQMVTPWVDVPTNRFKWTFRKYAADNLPPADDSKWTPRAAEYNWSDFETRWGAILNFFDRVNADPTTLWPMPSPNPDDPL